MMDADGFRTYLENVHAGQNGRPLSSRAAGDYVSRCRRVEALLGTDLDRSGQSLEAIVRRIDALDDGKANVRVKGNMQTAVRRYSEYRQRAC